MGRHHVWVVGARLSPGICVCVFLVGYLFSLGVVFYFAMFVLASQFWRVLLLWSWLSGCEERWLNSSKLIFTVKTDCCQRSFKSKNIICTPFLYIQGTPLRIWVPDVSVCILSLVHGLRPFTSAVSSLSWVLFSSALLCLEAQPLWTLCIFAVCIPVTTSDKR